MRFPSTPITVGMITPHQTTRTRLVSTDKTIIKSRPSNDSNSLLSTCPFHTHPILHPSQTSSPPHLFNPSYFLTSLGTTQTPYPPHPHFLFLSLSVSANYNNYTAQPRYSNGVSDLDAALFLVFLFVLLLLFFISFPERQRFGLYFVRHAAQTSLLLP